MSEENVEVLRRAMEAFDSTIGRNDHEVMPQQVRSVSAVTVAVRSEPEIRATSPK